MCWHRLFKLRLPTSLPPNGKLALAGQTRNCMVVLGCMLSVIFHLNDLCYFIKATDMEISDNRGDFVHKL